MLKAAAITARLGFPDAMQALRVTCGFGPFRWEWQTVTSYAVTSLTVGQATPPKFIMIIKAEIMAVTCWFGLRGFEALTPRCELSAARLLVVVEAGRPFGGSLSETFTDDCVADSCAVRRPAWRSALAADTGFRDPARRRCRQPPLVRDND
jgi:hypothetical protein